MSLYIGIQHLHTTPYQKKTKAIVQIICKTTADLAEAACDCQTKEAILVVTCNL